MSDTDEQDETVQEETPAAESGWTQEQVDAYEMDAFLTWLFQSDKK